MGEWQIASGQWAWHKRLIDLGPGYWSILFGVWGYYIQGDFNLV